jgi:hypothetical protein
MPDWDLRLNLTVVSDQRLPAYALAQGSARFGPQTAGRATKGAEGHYPRQCAKSR